MQRSTRHAAWLGLVCSLAGGCGIELAAQAEATTAAETERPVCMVVGGSVSNGLAWRDYESWAPEDPLEFAEKHLGRESIAIREYELRTRGISLVRTCETLLPTAACRFDEQSSIATVHDPNRMIRLQLSRITRGKPRLVIGLDLMFWFGFGVVPLADAEYSEADRAVDEALYRLARQQAAFRHIDAALAESPTTILVVGDYPAYPKPDELILPRSMHPSPRTHDELNHRLRRWAASRERVFVYPIAERLQQLVAGETSTVIGGDSEPLLPQQLLQFDGLHPNQFGAAFLTIDLCEFVREHVTDGAELFPAPPTFEGALRLLDLDVDDLRYLRESTRH